MQNKAGGGVGGELLYSAYPHFVNTSSKSRIQVVMAANISYHNSLLNVIALKKIGLKKCKIA